MQSITGSECLGTFIYLCFKLLVFIIVLLYLEQVVAVKQLDRNGLQGNREFLVEVLMLSLLHHPNLVNLIGYCADGDQRLLVYEFMPSGSLEDHLHGMGFFPVLINYSWFLHYITFSFMRFIKVNAPYCGKESN